MIDGDILRWALFIMGTVNLGVYGRRFIKYQRPRQFPFVLLLACTWGFYSILILHHYTMYKFQVTFLNQASLGLQLIIQLVFMTRRSHEQ